MPDTRRSHGSTRLSGSSKRFCRPFGSKGCGALTIAAAGQKADSAKPLTGLGSGILEVVLSYRTDAYRIVCATRIGDDIWVLHAFQKKSKSGIKTPRHEVDVIRNRIKRLKEMLS